MPRRQDPLAEPKEVRKLCRMTLALIWHLQHVGQGRSCHSFRIEHADDIRFVQDLARKLTDYTTDSMFASLPEGGDDD